ncbi:MAG: SRPBCC family protein [Reichenbachiella sp.]|uniref:SRPBCC family protein n=1 Tax=Reichenbachiella sp. TaxID=2184521 RepID=UPI00326620CB
MAFYQYKKVQVVEASLDEVWDFISSPANLKKITPEHMGFDITSDNANQKMYEGMIISYKVSPIPGFRTDWVTEITHVKDREFFVDEQRIGPYVMWHHQHMLEALGSSVVMKDIITYQPPLGFLGAIANSLYIRRQLNNIFEYRKVAVEKYFAKDTESYMTLA